MATEPDVRCGFELEVGLSTEPLSRDPCDRPVWADRNRCVWHAKEDGKTAEMLADARPESGENLDGAYLEEAELVGVDWFANASLVGADLAGARLNGSDFSGADLMLASLPNVGAFDVDFSGANLEGTDFTNADLRRATLEDAFLNEAVFTDVHIGGETNLGETSVYEREYVAPTLGDDHPLEAASWAYRQLRRIYQNNALHEQAQRSYNREKNARRKLAWRERDYPEAIKWELSRWILLYGSSPYRVILASVVVIVVSALIYPLTGGVQEIGADRAITYSIDNPETASEWWIGQVLFRSLYFSVVTFATLGYGDIQPVGNFARFLAGLESILGALLTALLVVVLTRIMTW